MKMSICADTRTYWKQRKDYGNTLTSTTGSGFTRDWVTKHPGRHIQER